MAKVSYLVLKAAAAAIFNFTFLPAQILNRLSPEFCCEFTPGSLGACKEENQTLSQNH